MANYVVAQMDEVAPVQCPCGQSRRAFVSKDNPVATLHMVDITADSRTHYHKKLTEIYLILEGTGDMELDGMLVPVKPLSAWGLCERASRLLEYWLASFVRPDGTIRYYGPSLSEYGQLLDLATTLDERASAVGGPPEWWAWCAAPLDRLAEHLLRLRAAAESEGGLLAGSPEADERERVRRYFHNNAWVARGLARWAEVCRRRGLPSRTPPARSEGTRARHGLHCSDHARREWVQSTLEWALAMRTGLSLLQFPSQGD